jgi:hypothetical protein
MEVVRESPREGALKILEAGLVPFVELSLRAAYGDAWMKIVDESRPKTLDALPQADGSVQWSADELLNTIIAHWRAFELRFKPRAKRQRGPQKPDFVAKGWVSELLEFRRRWAHGEHYTNAETDRFLDTCELLLTAAGADGEAGQVRGLHATTEWSSNSSNSSAPKLSIAQLNSSAPTEDHKDQRYGAERRNESEHNEYLKNVYAWYREHRPTLAKIARAYYASLPEALNLPMVTRSEWLPKIPIPLRELDRQLTWIEDERDLLPPQLEALGQETYSRLLERIAPNVQQEDRFCYRLLDVSSADGKMNLVFSPSRYRRFINSCEALGYELAEWFYRNQNDLDIQQVAKDGAYLRARGDPRAIFDLRMRSGCPGVSTFLLVLNAHQGDFFYLHRRSGPVLDSPDGLHVVPAGQFQPDTDEDVNHNRDFSIERTVIRELGEELLGIEKFKDVMRTSEDFYNHPRVAPIVRGINEGFVRGYFLGLGFDPLPTKPGILTALVIDASHLPPGTLEFTDNWEGRLLELPLGQLKKWSQDERLIPDGKTCLQLVQQHLEFLIGK